MYLFKYVSKCGVCSRRKTFNLIKTGLVKINGTIERNLYYNVLEDDIVEYDNKILQLPEPVYILLNKPKDYLCTLTDPRGRRNILELVDYKGMGRIYPIGRLDRMTTGLIVLTNDGDFTQRLAHPKYKIPKGYRVILDKIFEKRDFEKLLVGLYLDDGFMSTDKLAYFLGQKKNNNIVEITIHSGRNRIVRRIFEHLGYNVKKLDRFYYAGLTKRGLPVGKWRRLTQKEIDKLKKFSLSF